jgi:hypothetical protein
VDHERIVVAPRILIVPDVQEAVRTWLVFCDPPKQIEYSIVAVVAAPADEQMRRPVQVPRDLNKQKRRAKTLRAILEGRDEIVSTCLENGRFGFIRSISDDVYPTVELVHINRR